MFCRQCGKELAGGATFCKYCGSPQAGSAAGRAGVPIPGGGGPPQGTGTVPSGAGGPHAAPDPGLTTRDFIIIGALIALALLLVLVFAVT